MLTSLLFTSPTNVLFPYWLLNFHYQWSCSLSKLMKEQKWKPHTLVLNSQQPAKAHTCWTCFNKAWWSSDKAASSTSVWGRVIGQRSHLGAHWKHLGCFKKKWCQAKGVKTWSDSNVQPRLRTPAHGWELHQQACLPPYSCTFCGSLMCLFLYKLSESISLQT